MATVVRIPVEWVRATSGRRRLAARGRTVGACLAYLAARYPGLVEELAEGCELFVNWENVRLRAGLDSAVGPADAIQVVPPRG